MTATESSHEVEKDTFTKSQITTAPGALSNTPIASIEVSSINAENGHYNDNSPKKKNEEDALIYGWVLQHRELYNEAAQSEQIKKMYQNIKTLTDQVNNYRNQAGSVEIL